MYVCMHVVWCMYVLYVCSMMHVCMYVSMYVCMYYDVCVCMYVCSMMHVCMYVLYVCMYSMYVSIYTHYDVVRYALSNNYIYGQYVICVCMYVCEANMSSRTLPASTSWFIPLLHCWMRSKSRFFCCLRLRAIEARAVANSSSSWETQQVRGLEFTDTCNGTEYRRNKIA